MWHIFERKREGGGTAFSLPVIIELVGAIPAVPCSIDRCLDKPLLWDPETGRLNYSSKLIMPLDINHCPSHVICSLKTSAPILHPGAVTS